jgi:hypothetical protein
MVYKNQKSYLDKVRFCSHTCMRVTAIFSTRLKIVCHTYDADHRGVETDGA